MPVAKLYLVNVLNEQFLVRAATTRGAVRTLTASIMSEALKSAHIATADDMLELVLTTGIPTIIEADESADDETPSTPVRDIVGAEDSAVPPVSVTPDDGSAVEHQNGQSQQYAETAGAVRVDPSHQLPTQEDHCRHGLSTYSIGCASPLAAATANDHNE